MDWLGIGVFILAIGFAVLVAFIIPVLKKLTVTISKTADTVDQAEKSLAELTNETRLLLYNTNETLMDVNDKIAKLDPIFDVVEDSGQAAHSVTSTIADFTEKRTERVKDGNKVVNKHHYKGLMKGVALIYYLRQAKSKNKFKQEPVEVKLRNEVAK